MLKADLHCCLNLLSVMIEPEFGLSNAGNRVMLEPEIESDMLNLS